MDPQICYICATTSVFYSRNLLKTKSKYSETRIYDFICKFLGKLPGERRHIQTNDNEYCVCIECLNKIDEYDLTTITARRIETELRELLLHAEASGFPETKVFSSDNAAVAAANRDDAQFVAPIETVEVHDQFKVESCCNESTEPSDLIESILNECDGSMASDSDDEYYPPGSKKPTRRTASKTKRKSFTRGPQQPKPHLQQNLKCSECNVEFKRYFYNISRKKTWIFD